MLTLKFNVDEFKKGYNVKFRKGKAETWIQEAYNQKGQKFIKKTASAYELCDSIFSKSRKVEDEIRFQINSDGVVLDSISDKIYSRDGNVAIAIILESPHKREYGYIYNHAAIRPANGVTGDNIYYAIKEAELVDNIITNIGSDEFEIFEKSPKNLDIIIQICQSIWKEKSFTKGLEKTTDLLENKPELINRNIDIYLVNRICYQTSLGSYYNEGLIEPIRNNIFKCMWKDEEISGDFNKRLLSINPDILINACTKGVDKGAEDFNEYLIKLLENNEKLDEFLDCNHPSSWNRGINMKVIKIRE